MDNLKYFVRVKIGLPFFIFPVKGYQQNKFKIIFKNRLTFVSKYAYKYCQNGSSVLCKIFPLSISLPYSQLDYHSQLNYQLSIRFLIIIYHYHTIFFHLSS